MLENINDEAEIFEAKRRFERDWSRRKAEYDQAQRRQAKKEAEALESAAQKALKKRKKER